MNRVRVILFLLAAACLALGAWSILRPQDRHSTPAVRIEDGKTLDFSSGRVVVKDNPREKAALDKAVSEMDAVAANVTFTPRPKPTPTTSR